MAESRPESTVDETAFVELELSVENVLELTHLSQRLSKAIERGKSIQLSARDLDLLVVVGAYEMLATSVSAAMKNLSQQRLQKTRQKEQPGISSSAPKF